MMLVKDWKWTEICNPILYKGKNKNGYVHF